MKLGVTLTPEVIDKIKWEAFWDAPLYIEGSGELPPTHQAAIPAMKGVANQPGPAAQAGRSQARDRDVPDAELRGEDQRRAAGDQFPGRRAGRLRRPAAVRRVQGIEPDSPGGDRQDRRAVGRLQVRRRAQGPADPGRPRASAGATSRGRWQDQQFGGPVNDDPAHGVEQQPPDRRGRAGRIDCGVPAAAQLLLARASPNRSSATTTTARTATPSFAFGSGRPRRKKTRSSCTTSRSPARGPARGSACRCSSTSARTPATAALDAALAFTHGDRFKPLPGYQVMGSHYHVGMVPRLEDSGSLDNRLNDVEAMKAAGDQHLRDHRRRPRPSARRGVSRRAGRVLRRRAAAVGQELPGDAEQGEHRASTSAAITT